MPVVIDWRTPDTFPTNAIPSALRDDYESSCATHPTCQGQYDTCRCRRCLCHFLSVIVLLVEKDELLVGVTELVFHL